MAWAQDEIKEALRDTLTGHARPPEAMHRKAHAHDHYTAYGRGAAIADGWDAITYETPTRAPTAGGDVVVPLAQAMISGCLAAILAAVVIRAAELDHTLWVALAIGAGTAASVWAALLRDHRRLLRTVETWERGPKATEPTRAENGGDEVVKLEVRQDRGKDHGPGYLFADLPIHAGMFRAWARSVLDGRSLSQANWTGGHNPFSRADYEDLLSFLERARIIRWRNPEATAQGRELTDMGREALRSYLGMDG